MDEKRFRKDISILASLKRQKVIRGFDFKLDGTDDWLIIFGAAKLPTEKFNLPDYNLKLPIPDNLYECEDGSFQFYDTIFIDEKLRKRSGNKWRHINRQFPDYYPTEAGLGWAYLCVLPKYVRKETDIRSLFPLVQSYLIERG